MKYWLIKSEGDCYSIDDFRKDTEKGVGVPWSGIRNFQARNFMREMQVGDLALFYHSNGTPAKPTGVYGVAKVTKTAHIDATALDSSDEHYDPKAVTYQKEGKEPMWVCPDMIFVQKFTDPVSLDAIKFDPMLEGILVAKRGQRLSVMPVEKKHFDAIVKKGR